MSIDTGQQRWYDSGVPMEAIITEVLNAKDQLRGIVGEVDDTVGDRCLIALIARAGALLDSLDRIQALADSLCAELDAFRDKSSADSSARLQRKRSSLL